MSLLVPWLAFPAVLGLLSLGCGLLVERSAGRRLPSALVLPVGYAALVVAAGLATMSDVTARFAAPLVVALAVAGLGLSFLRRGHRFDGWALACALGVFAAYAAPIVLFGEATFAGYIKLDDTASFLGMTDRVMEHGRSLAGLPPSTYQAVLDVNLAHGYPVGSLMPLGVGAKLVDEDPAWLFQPAMAFSAAMLALALYALLAQLVRSRGIRALAAFVAAQAALLFAYSLWGGIKELAAAALLPLVAALVPELLGAPARARDLLPPAVATAALLGILSAGGGIWLVPLLLPAFVLVGRLGGRALTARSAVVFAAVAGALSLPSLVAAGEFLRPANDESFTSGGELGNLIRPLKLIQVFGIWPAGDFRTGPAVPVATYLLIGVAALAAAVGVVLAWRARAWGPLLYVGAAVVGAGVLVGVGSPWVAAKAMATASPAFVAAGLAGAALAYDRGWRFEGVAVAAVIAGGVLWSNALAYHDVWLAPRGQLVELERIGQRFGGGGPTLMTEYQPYGVRHFLRDMDPEGASEFRYRRVPLRDGRLLDKGEFADVDQLRLPDLLVYRTLVLRRSPAESRPPSPYALVWSGHFYDVWQRPDPPTLTVVEHLPLGDVLHAGARPRCSDVLRLAGLASRAGGRLVAATPSVAIVLPVAEAGRSQTWENVAVPASGRYEVWLGGSLRRRVEVSVDGRRVGEARHELNNTGQYDPLGAVVLHSGAHRVALHYGGSSLLPGSGGGPFPLGPLVLGRNATHRPLRSPPPPVARSLCGKTLDWIEVVRAEQ